MELILSLFKLTIYLHKSYVNAWLTRCSKLEIIQWRHRPTDTSIADLAVMTCGKPVWKTPKQKPWGLQTGCKKVTELHQTRVNE